MAKLATFNGTYIPKDVEFNNEVGKMIPNSELPVGKQVKFELTFADIDQKSFYMQTYAESGATKKDSVKMKTDYKYNEAMKKHVLKIENLDGFRNGIDLSKSHHPGLNELKQDLFFRICGIRVDDEPNDGPGEFTEGEELASV